MEDIEIKDLFKGGGNLEEFAKLGLIFSLFDDLDDDIDTFIITFLGRWDSGNAFEEIILGKLNFIKKIEIVNVILENKDVSSNCKLVPEDIKFINEFRILRNHIAHSRYHDNDNFKKRLVDSKNKAIQVPSNKDLYELKEKLETINKKVRDTCNYYFKNNHKLPVIQTKNFFYNLIDN